MLTRVEVTSSPSNSVQHSLTLWIDRRGRTARWESKDHPHISFHTLRLACLHCANRIRYWTLWFDGRDGYDNAPEEDRGRWQRIREVARLADEPDVAWRDRLPRAAADTFRRRCLYAGFTEETRPFISTHHTYLSIAINADGIKYDTHFNTLVPFMLLVPAVRTWIDIPTRSLSTFTSKLKRDRTNTKLRCIRMFLDGEVIAVDQSIKAYQEEAWRSRSES